MASLRQDICTHTTVSDGSPGRRANDQKNSKVPTKKPSKDSQNHPPFYPFTLLPFYPFTLLPFYPFTLLPFYPFTLLPFYPFTLLPFYPFTLLPFYPFTLLPFYPFTLLPFYPFTLLPFYPFTLLPCRFSLPTSHTSSFSSLMERVHDPIRVKRLSHTASHRAPPCRPRSCPFCRGRVR